MFKKTRLLSMVISVCLISSMFPVVASANEMEAVVTGTSEKTELFTDSKDSFGMKEGWNFGVNSYFADKKTRSVSNILVGGVDAVANPVGEDWSFDASTATLTLDGAVINSDETLPAIVAEGNLKIVASGDEVNTLSGMFGIMVNGDLQIEGGKIQATSTGGEYAAIYATGDILLTDCNLDLDGELVAISGDKGLTINGSVVKAEASMTYEEALEVQTNYPPVGIYTQNAIHITENSDVTASGAFVGIISNQEQIVITDSTVNASGNYYGIAGYTDVTLDNSKINASADISLNDLYFQDILLMTVGIGASTGDVSIAASEVTVNSTIIGILVDDTEGTLDITDSTLDVEAGYLGVASLSDMTVSGSEIAATMTMTPVESVVFAKKSTIDAPAAAMYVVNKNGSCKVEDSDLNLTCVCMGVGADNVMITGTDAEITDSIIGIYGGKEVVLTDCNKIYVTNSVANTQAFMKAKGKLPAEPCNIVSENVVITGCKDMILLNGYMGIFATAEKVILTNSAVDIEAGAFGIAATEVEIQKSDAQIDVTFTKKQANELGYNDVMAVLGDYGVSVADCYILEGGTTGEYVIQVTDDISFNVYSIVDDEGKAATSTTISVRERLKFASASLTLHDNIAINFKVATRLFTEAGYSNPYVVFEHNGEKTTVTESYESGKNTVFDFTNIAPHQMDDTITATIYAEHEGIVYEGESLEYSVSKYAYNMLNRYNTDDWSLLRTLLVDLLNYGGESQIYMEYNTDSLVNSRLTEEQKAWGTAEARDYENVLDTAYETVKNPAVTWKSAGLNLKDRVEIRLKFVDENVDNLVVKARTDNGDEWIIEEADFEPIEGGGYYVYFNKFNAGQMSEAVYFTVYSGDKAVSNTLRYSIESYASSTISKAESNESYVAMAELLKAMMKYGDSAKNYINQ